MGSITDARQTLVVTGEDVYGHPHPFGWILQVYPHFTNPQPTLVHQVAIELYNILAISSTGMILCIHEYTYVHTLYIYIHVRTSGTFAPEAGSVLESLAVFPITKKNSICTYISYQLQYNTHAS